MFAIGSTSYLRLTGSDLYSALVGVTDEAGNSIFKGRTATCFTNEEETQNGTVNVCPPALSSLACCTYLTRDMVEQAIPFLVEDRIKSLGGNFEKTEPWGVSA